MIRVCPVIHRAWWRVKALFPWVDKSQKPAPVPSMKHAEDTLKTAIFDLSELLDNRK